MEWQIYVKHRDGWWKKLILLFELQARLASFVHGTLFKFKMNEAIVMQTLVFDGNFLQSDQSELVTSKKTTQ